MVRLVISTTAVSVGLTYQKVLCYKTRVAGEQLAMLDVPNSVLKMLPSQTRGSRPNYFISLQQGEVKEIRCGCSESNALHCLPYPSFPFKYPFHTRGKETKHSEPTLVCDDLNYDRRSIQQIHHIR
jgi:hypothetical protein